MRFIILRYSRRRRACERDDQHGKTEMRTSMEVSIETFRIIHLPHRQYEIHMKQPYPKVQRVKNYQLWQAICKESILLEPFIHTVYHYSWQTIL